MQRKNCTAHRSGFVAQSSIFSVIHHSNRSHDDSLHDRCTHLAIISACLFCSIWKTSRKWRSICVRQLHGKNDSPWKSQRSNIKKNSSTWLSYGWGYNFNEIYRRINLISQTNDTVELAKVEWEKKQLNISRTATYRNKKHTHTTQCNFTEGCRKYLWSDERIFGVLLRREKKQPNKNVDPIVAGK